jgi:hypothetical protein
MAGLYMKELILRRAAQGHAGRVGRHNRKQGCRNDNQESVSGEFRRSFRRALLVIEPTAWGSRVFDTRRLPEKASDVAGERGTGNASASADADRHQRTGTDGS